MSERDPRENSTPMSPERWAQVRALVEDVLICPREGREAFLDASCRDDDALRDQVERLTAACERAGESWGFLAQPAGALAAPLLAAAGALESEQASQREELSVVLSAALTDRYAVERVLGRGGMATVYVAEDLRHHRRVALKVLEPKLGALLGVERFLAEIRVTAGLKHPNLLPLFDSGEADGLLYYVMPLMEGATLRERIQRERQLPVDDAVRIVRAIASALDYAHRQGVVHRDLKPENILLQDGEPLVADFGISLAITQAATERLTADGMSLGTPSYMSPEQAAGDPAVDGRSDIYSLACVLYELLAGEPPFTGNTVQAVLAKVLAQPPPSVRTLRPSVPEYVDVALVRAMSKLPADRFATAREFSDALGATSMSVPASARANGPRSWTSTRLVLAGTAAAIVGLAIVGWMAFGNTKPPQSFVYDDLIDQSMRSTVTITPDGSTLVYTGPAEAGRPIMLRIVGELGSHVIAGTEGGALPFVAPDGHRLAFWTTASGLGAGGTLKTVAIEGVAGGGNVISENLRRIFKPRVSWRYGNGAWAGDSTIVTEYGVQGLSKRERSGDTLSEFTRADSTRGGGRHAAPLLLPDARTVVFTVTRTGGPLLVRGPLAITTLTSGTTSPSSHVMLGVTARRAFAFVDGWLLYTSADGKAIMAGTLDVVRQRITGTPVTVLEDPAGNLETATLADNGTLLYVRRPRANALVIVDTSGASRPGLTSGDGSFMYPRISPNGDRFVVQVTTAGMTDLWLYDMASRTRTQLTTSGTALHPAWTPDGRRIVFREADLILMSQPLDGGAAERIPNTESPFAPTVAHTGRAALFQRKSPTGWRVWSASLSGEGPARKVMEDSFDNYMPALSPNGRWLAFVSKRNGTEKVYARPYPGPGQATLVSEEGGNEPAWSHDGTRIYYLHKGALRAADVDVSASNLAVKSTREQFKREFDNHLMPHRNYDVMPNGAGFLTIAPPPNPAAVVVMNWLPVLRRKLASAR